MGDKTQVFRSPEEIPAALRKQLVASTRGMNSATILIADRGGRAEIRKILDGQPSPLKSRLRADFLRRSIDDRPAQDPLPVPNAAPQPMSIRDWKLRHWAELLLPGAVGIGLWVLFTWK
jgi:hypothetical protein